jgi:hypothetical protein
MVRQSIRIVPAPNPHFSATARTPLVCGVKRLPRLMKATKVGEDLATKAMDVFLVAGAEPESQVASRKGLQVRALLDVEPCLLESGLGRLRTPAHPAQEPCEPPQEFWVARMPASYRKQERECFVAPAGTRKVTRPAKHAIVSLPCRCRDRCHSAMVDHVLIAEGPIPASSTGHLSLLVAAIASRLPGRHWTPVATP